MNGFFEMIADGSTCGVEFNTQVWIRGNYYYCFYFIREL